MAPSAPAMMANHARQSPPAATTISPPTSTATSTVTTAHEASTSSPPAAASTAGSSLSSPKFPTLPHNAYPRPASTLSTTLPPTSPSSQRQIAEARQAVIASIGNMLDSSLGDRASVLHSNAAAIAKQERDVAKATEALRKENDKLAKVAGDAAKKVKELGNVQNWAEVLESDFLALEETIRLVRQGSEGSWTGSEGSWSGSETGSEGDEGHVGDVRMADADGDRGEEGGASSGADKGKGKATDLGEDGAMDVDVAPSASGQTDRSLNEPETGNTSMDLSGAHVPVAGKARDAPSIKVPGMEPLQTSTVSLEDELRLAMGQPIGNSG